MNRLTMAMIETILSLHQRGWSNRRIARELGVDRDAVSRHVRRFRAGAKAAKVITGSEASQAAIGGLAEEAKSRSLCEPWRAVIAAKLDAGLTAQRIYQDLVGEHGFAGHYHSVRRFVLRLCQPREVPFRRMECAAGEEAQVDFGSGIPLTGLDGRRRKTTDDFLSCLENAFWYFGGVPKTLVLDNLKAGVETPDWFDPELNPKLRSFADHYGVAILPTRPRMPRHKGKIESGVGYVKNNALKGRSFPSLEEENH